MADIVAMTLPDNKTYYFKDSRVAVPVPADAVFTDHIFSGLAEDVDYDNTTSGLTSTNVQDALDEIAEGGGSTGCVELTQAQYDALPREAKMADVIYLITDSPDNYLDEVFGDFASVEYTSTASKAYAVGDYLVYDSKFYKVTSAIAQGATIVPNTNVVKTTVADEFSNATNVQYDNTESGLEATDVQGALDEVNANQSPVIKTVTYTLGTNVSYRGLTVKTLGNIAFVNFYFDVSQDLSNNSVLLSVSPAFPSPKDTYAVATVHGVGSDSGMVHISNGDATKIKAWGTIPKATYYYAQFVYICI